MAVWKWIVETAATWTAVGIWIRLLFSLAVGMFIGIDRGLKLSLIHISEPTRP